MTGGVGRPVCPLPTTYPRMIVTILYRLEKNELPAIR